MAKDLFFCKECGWESRGWLGKCPGCGSWNTFVEAPTSKQDKKKKKGGNDRGWLQETDADLINLNEVDAEQVTRFATGLPELDLVLGGGLVPGSLILLGGEPGVGKSTLLLQILNSLETKEPQSVVYLSGEESPGQIKLRAERLGVAPSKIRLLASTNLQDLFRILDITQPKFCMIDSIQTLYDDNLSAAPGSPTQLREVTAQLLRRAKADGMCIILVGHVTKDGQIAGPRILEHMVDTVLYFEGQDTGFRLLRAHKNRFGSVDELGVFELDDKGLKSVPNPSVQLLAGRPQDVPGIALSVSLEGSRPLVIELQALVNPTAYAQAMRMTEGLERNRLSLLLAIVEHATGLMLGQQDVYVNVTGGLRLKERATDLAVIAACLSSYQKKALPANMILLGEVGLAGELRRVPEIEQRVTEAYNLGFRRFVVPSQAEVVLKNLDLPENPEFFYASFLTEVVDWLFP